MTEQIDWHIGEMWNLAAFKPDRPLVKRSYSYASELGGSFYTRYLKMVATEPTNPPNERSRGKFLAGNMWEDNVKKVAKICGIYKSSEDKIDNAPYSDTIEVHGRCDLIAGAFDKEKALHQLEQIKDFIIEDLYWKGKGIIEHLGGKPLKDKIIEIKSCSEYVLNRVEKTKLPIIIHGHQAYFYSRSKNLPAEVSYISKNDSFMADLPVDPNLFEPLLRNDLEQMTYYITKAEVPPQDPFFSFNTLMGKFEKNIQVEYCPYLAMRGFASPYDFRQAVEPKLAKWNNVLTRYAKIESGQLTPTGKTMKASPQNQEVRNEIIASGFDFNKLLEIKIDFLNEEQSDEEE